MTRATGRGRHFTIRARIATTYAALLACTGALMLGGVYLFMRFVPVYALSGPATPSGPAASTTGATTTEGSASSFAGAPVVRSGDDVLKLLLSTSIIALVVLGLLGALAGWVLAGRMLRPLHAINAVARQAASGDLSQRVDAQGPQDELRELSETFDDMLTKLERAFGEHQRFAANASHELMTPIAASQTMLQVALADPDIDTAGLRTMAQRLSELTRRNAETVAALLALANTGSPRLSPDKVSLDTLTHDALLCDKDEIAEHGLAVTTDIQAVAVTGDAPLLRQAIRNLIQNAVRHNLAGGTLRAEVTSTGDTAAVIVENDGAELVAADVSSFAEPFVRGAGRVAGPAVRGHGLGLALVNSVAQAHRGTLTLEPRDGGGLRATLLLPANPGAA